MVFAGGLGVVYPYLRLGSLHLALLPMGAVAPSWDSWTLAAARMTSTLSGSAPPEPRFGTSMESQYAQLQGSNAPAPWFKMTQVGPSSSGRTTEPELAPPTSTPNGSIPRAHRFG